METRLTARRGENLLAMVGIPVAVLLFFGSVEVLPVPAGGGARITSLLPGTLALAVIATGLVNLGIATAYERSYGVLKRLGGSPLGRTGLVAAKLADRARIEVGQVVALVAIAWLVFGWRPGDEASRPLFVGAVLLGTAAFAGLGLAMAGSLRAEATLTLANALFLAFLLLGGLLVPADRLPDTAGPAQRPAAFERPRRGVPGSPREWRRCRPVARGARALGGRGPPRGRSDVPLGVTTRPASGSIGQRSAR